MSLNLTKFTENMDKVASLDNQPSITASQLKAKFDEGGKAIKTYLNDTLTTEITSQVTADIASCLSSAKSYTDTKVAAISTTAADVSYDNSTSGMTATNVQAATDELRSNITSVNSNLTSVTTRVTSLENGSGITKTASAISISNGTKDYEETIKQNGLVHLFVNVKSSNVDSNKKSVIGTLNTGYLPKTNIKRKCFCNSNTGGGNSWFADLYLNTGGTVQIDNQTLFTINDYSFDITFSVV